jgi:hypothetical protein
MMTINGNIIPKFENEEQEAKYWENHSPLDLMPEPTLEKIRINGLKDRPIAIRLDGKTRIKLNELAAKQGMGPSTCARVLLVKAIEGKQNLPDLITQDEFKDLLEKSLTKETKERVESLMKEISIGKPENPYAFLFSKSQIDEWGELGLQAILSFLSMYGIIVITPEHHKYEEIKNLVQSNK